MGIESRLDDAYRVEQLADAFEGEIFGLYGYDYRVGGSESVDSNKAERRRTVDDNIIVFILYRFEESGEYILSIGLRDKFYLGSGKIDARSDKEQTFHACRHLRPVERISVDHTFVDRRGHRSRIDTVARSGVGLRIGVDNKHLFTLGGKRSRQVYSSGGLAYTAFLVCYRYDFSHCYVSVRDCECKVTKNM